MGISLAVLVVLLVLNGVLAMSELAVMTSRRARLQLSASQGSKSATAALTLANEPTRFLSTVQVGITLIGILAGAFGEKQLSGHVESLIHNVEVLAPYSDTIALFVVVVLITYFSLVFGELVPKRIALAFPEAAASFIARPLLAMSVVMAGPVRVLTWSTERVLRILRVRPTTVDDVSGEDVEALVARAASTGVFTPQEHALMKRVIELGEMRARDLMVPRPVVVGLEAESSVESVHRVVRESRHSHYPVCQGGLDNVVGVVHIKDLIGMEASSGAPFPFAGIMTEPAFIPETSPLPQLLELFRHRESHVAFVVNEFGSMQGLITLSDVVERLLGQRAGNGRGASEEAARRADGSWLIDGRMNLREALSILGIDGDQHATPASVSTVAGLVIAELGHIPVTTERVTFAGHRFEVMDMDGARVDKVLVTRLDAPIPDAP